MCIYLRESALLTSVSPNYLRVCVCRVALGCNRASDRGGGGRLIHAESRRITEPQLRYLLFGWRGKVDALFSVSHTLVTEKCSRLFTYLSG